MKGIIDMRIFPNRPLAFSIFHLYLVHKPKNSTNGKKRQGKSNPDA
jgi:hypothetical protein